MIDGLDDGYIWWDDGDGLLMSWIIVSKIDRECEVIHIRSKIYISCCCLNPPNDVDDYDDDDHHTKIVCHYYKFVFKYIAPPEQHHTPTHNQPYQSSRKLHVLNKVVRKYLYLTYILMYMHICKHDIYAMCTWIALQTNHENICKYDVQNQNCFKDWN